jgi:hypothetical protein
MNIHESEHVPGAIRQAVPGGWLYRSGQSCTYVPDHNAEHVVRSNVENFRKLNKMFQEKVETNQNFYEMTKEIDVQTWIREFGIEAFLIVVSENININI